MIHHDTTANALSGQLELRRELLQTWDEGPWQERLKQLAEQALKTRMTPTQGRQFQNICTSSLTCNDVTNYIYAQMGKNTTAWPLKTWPDQLLELLAELREEARKKIPESANIAQRLALQSATLMLFRKCGDSFASFLNYFYKRGHQQ